MKRNIFLGLVMIAILGGGCAKMTIEGSGTPDVTCPSDTVWQSYYGFDWNEYKIKKASNGLGLYQVTIHDNYLYSLIAVLSCGIAVPREIEWQIQQPEPEDEDVELMQPGMRVNATEAR